VPATFGGYSLTEPERIKIVKLSHPAQCVLWEHPERITGKFAEIFDEVEAYEDSSHLTRSLYKCRECGQLYFHEWYEWVDWKKRQRQDVHHSHTCPDASRIDTLKETDTFMLMTFFPRLQLDGKPKWVGKD